MGKHRYGVVGSLGGIAVALMGCIEEAEDVRSPELVGTGVYEVSVTTVTDTCAPMRLEGRRRVSDVFVYRDGAEIAPMLPAESAVVEEGFERANLHREESFTASKGRGDVVGADCGGEAIYLTRLSLTAADESGLTVRRWTEWKVVTPCQREPGPGGRGRELPQESCSVKQDVRYELVQHCEAPCKLYHRGGEDYACECQ